MISVTILKNNNDAIGFVIEGHSTLGKKGSDVLCASVSTISQSIIIGLVKVLEINISFEREDGYLYCELPPYLDKPLEEKASVLISTLTYSLMDIEKQFPDKVEVIISNHNK